VQGLGLLGRRYRYYAVKAGVLATALAAVWVGFALLGDHWAQLGVAAGLAVVLTQVVFLSHDAAHRQIFRSNRANELAALIMGTGIGGVSLAWWNTKHTKHHAAPNFIDKDSDIAPSIVHFYPAEQPPRSRLGMFLHEHQGWWFFPLLVVEMLNLHAQSVVALLTRQGMKRRAAELSLMAVRLLGYPVLLFWFLPTGMAAAFLGVQLAVTGVYLGASFAASHIGMPVLPADSRLDFLRRQVLLSRNVSGGGVASLAMGGLNYQIEHHLFPNMPRPSLHRARPVVQAFCRAHDITYQEVTIVRAWAIVAGYLNRVGRAGRDPFRCPVVAALR
jgi:fatty acid desaturase